MKNSRIGTTILIVVLLLSFYLNLCFYHSIGDKNVKLKDMIERSDQQKSKIKEMEKVIINGKVEVALKQIEYVNSITKLKKTIKTIDSQANKTNRKVDLRPSEFIQAIQETTLDSLKIPTKDTVLLVDTVVIKIQTFEDSTAFYRLKGSIKEGELNLDQVSIPNTITVTTGVKDQTLFKKGIPYTTIVNSNPHVSVTGMKVVAVKPKEYKGWKWALRGAIFAGGIYTGIRLSK